MKIKLWLEFHVTKESIHIHYDLRENPHNFSLEGPVVEYFNYM